MNRMVALVAVALFGITPAQVEAVKADYAYCATQGIEARYAWMPAEDKDLIAALKYQVVATTQQPLIDASVPQQLGTHPIWRLNLTALNWRTKDWSRVAGFKNNGYTKHENPLFVPAGWLVNELADCREGGNAYFQFLFQGNPPKTEEEFLARFGLSREQQGVSRFGWVESDSGVNVTKDGARIVEHLDGPNSEGWATYDVRKIVKGSDPLDALFPEKLKYDASEVFVLVPKVGTEGVRGVFPITGLFNGDGAVSADAPGDIVKDSTATFGHELIINNGSCVSCHNEGSKKPSINAVRERLLAGLELKTYDQQKQIEAELYHLGDVEKALLRWDEDYASALMSVNGLTPLENSTAYRNAIRKHLGDVTLAVAAAELSTDAETLRLSIAWSVKNYVDVQSRVAGLAHDRSMPRNTFEDQYLKLQSYLEAFRNN